MGCGKVEAVEQDSVTRRAAGDYCPQEGEG